MWLYSNCLVDGVQQTQQMQQMQELQQAQPRQMTQQSAVTPAAMLPARPSLLQTPSNVNGSSATPTKLILRT